MLASVRNVWSSWWINSDWRSQTQPRKQRWPPCHRWVHWSAWTVTVSHYTPCLFGLNVKCPPNRLVFERFPLGRSRDFSVSEMTSGGRSLKVTEDRALRAIQFVWLLARDFCPLLVPCERLSLQACHTLLDPVLLPRFPHDGLYPLNSRPGEIFPHDGLHPLNCKPREIFL